MRSRYGRRAFRASPIRCVGERIKVTGVPEFREVAWRACSEKKELTATQHDALQRILNLENNGYHLGDDSVDRDEKKSTF